MLTMKDGHSLEKVAQQFKDSSTTPHCFTVEITNVGFNDIDKQNENEVEFIIKLDEYHYYEIDLEDVINFIKSFTDKNGYSHINYNGDDIIIYSDPQTAENVIKALCIINKDDIEKYKMLINEL